MKVSMKDEIKGNYVIKEYSFEDEAGKAAFWHTAAHVLAQAVKRLYPEAKCAIGPSIKEGFYYDFDFGFQLGVEELERIESEMRKIANYDSQSGIWIY